jgi:hypothetical protein
MSTIVISNIKATGETASRAVSGVAAAWVYAQQRTATVEIKGSYNVSSWSDDATGRSTTNLTNSMDNTTYHIGGSSSYDSTSGNNQSGADEVWIVSASSTKHDTAQNVSYLDCDFVFDIIHGDLA